jgi:hypothetical protein
MQAPGRGDAHRRQDAEAERDRVGVLPVDAALDHRRRADRTDERAKAEDAVHRAEQLSAVVEAGEVGVGLAVLDRNAEACVGCRRASRIHLSAHAPMKK